MSIFIVNVDEPLDDDQQSNQRLRHLAETFNGEIFHRDGGHGSFMVHEQQELTPAVQIGLFEAYVAKNMERGCNFEALRDEKSGHVVYNLKFT